MWLTSCAKCLTDAQQQQPSWLCSTIDIIFRDWNEATLEEMYESLIDDLPLSPSAPGGMIQYRRALTLSMALKVYLEVNEALIAAGIQTNPIPDRLKSAAAGFHTKDLKSSQYFQVVSADNCKKLISKSVLHLVVLVYRWVHNQISPKRLPKKNKRIGSWLSTCL